MEREINKGIEEVVYLDTPTPSTNGLYVIMAGKTYPSSEYYMFRTDRSGIFWGGVYVFEYIISGKGYIECDGNKYEVGEGDFIFMNAQRNVVYYADTETPYEKIWINFSGAFIKGIVSGLGFDETVYILKYDAFPGIYSMHRTLMKITAENKDYSLDTIASELCNLFLAINREIKTVDKINPAKKYSTAEKIKNYIDSIIIPNLNLDDLSREFSLDKGYIVHRFTSKYRISPYKYINTRKIEAAKAMLTEKNMKIYEIASALGYSGTQHFSSSFKKAVGITPKEYASRYK